MILPFYGNDGILSILLSRLTQCKLADSIIVATTSSSPDDAICDLVREHRVKCFRGDEMMSWIALFKQPDIMGFRKLSEFVLIILS